MSAGTNFSQLFTLTQVDGTAVDITGYTFYSKMAKHEGAVNVITSTSAEPVWKYIAIPTTITNATSGEYTLSLDPSVTVKLDEGKYVYSVVSEDASAVKTEILSGLIFVDKAFGNIESFGTVDPNYP